VGQKIPTWENVNPDDPAEALQPALVALPFVGDQTFTPQDDILQKWSKRFTDVGLVYGPHLAKLADENGNIHVSQLPQPSIKLRAARRGPQHTLNGLSDWVPVDTPDDEPVVIPDVGLYTRAEQEVIAEQLRYHNVIQDEELPRSNARTYSLSQFDPSAASPSEVNGYLKGVQSQGNVGEMRRVIAAEMTGKKRDQILRKWPGV